MYQNADLEADDTEIVWIELHLRKRVILLGNIYRPPKAGKEVLDSVSHMLDIMATEKKVILMGDMNINLLKSKSSQADELLLITEDDGLTQLISEPTRITDHSQSLIDVLFCSNDNLISEAGATAVTSSDHLMIYGECTENFRACAMFSTVRSFKKCDVTKLISDLNRAPWHVSDIFQSIDDQWNYWKKLFLEIVDEHAPLVKIRTRKSRVDWIDKDH